jgi:hypothetical protein
VIGALSSGFGRFVFFFGSDSDIGEASNARREGMTS